MFSVFSVSVDWGYGEQIEVPEDRKVENITPHWDLQIKSKDVRQVTNFGGEES